MPTRQEIIAAARRDQHDRALATQQTETKPAIVGMGDRHADTGLFDVLLPDGSIELGEKQFNSALPSGAQVLGIPQAAGGWVLDERDVVTVPPVEVEEQKTTGVVMWLDSDWYSTQAQSTTPASCFKALKKMFSVFGVDRKKVIYTLDPAVYPYFDSFANLKNPRLQPFFEAQHYKVLATTIEVALAKRGTFWLPLLSFGTIYTLTDTDFANLIKIAKTGGLYVSGEYNFFTAYNDFLLRGLGIRPEVANAYNSGASTAPADYQGRRKLNGVTFRGQAYNRFIGLSETEILAVESVTQDPVFAFFKPSSLATP